MNRCLGRVQSGAAAESARACVCVSRDRCSETEAAAASLDSERKRFQSAFTPISDAFLSFLAADKGRFIRRFVRHSFDSRSADCRDESIACFDNSSRRPPLALGLIGNAKGSAATSPVIRVPRIEFIKLVRYSAVGSDCGRLRAILKLENKFNRAPFRATEQSSRGRR